ncbi:hypothetical protein Micbo1qcDRAFT_155718 [Microdochium bolleyi]|uniref:Uncharacterized protein n=1 Tax=Microdochium bolleyi TaxID=196109 RepID=A0A136JIK5_9PEZI|nr:hypothetical protein Micbo1qcDRAFT_155718 [Microdochium bolleyi]
MSSKPDVWSALTTGSAGQFPATATWSAAGLGNPSTALHARRPGAQAPAPDQSTAGDN